MTNMNVIPVSQDSYIVNGCKVKITYAEDGDSMRDTAQNGSATILSNTILWGAMERTSLILRLAG